ncbi:MAG: endonuclease/exonuclease/phosphatase family protein [Candidatus Hydrogenedentota bacterium]
MTRLIIAGMAILIAVAAQPARADTSLTIMTYNIHHGRGLDGEVDLERLARVIRAEAPDVVCLQEVDRGMERTDGLDMPAFFAAALDMEVVYQTNLRIGEGEYGNATLSRHPITDYEDWSLPGPEGVWSLGCLKTTIDVNSVPVHVLNTHMGLNEEERKAQAGSILNRLPEGPVIFAGDVNEETGASAINAFLEVLQDTFGYHSGDVEYTISADNPRRRIDYILASSHLDVLSSRVIASEEARVASDHFPYVAAVTVPDPPESAADRGVFGVDDEQIEEQVGEEHP